MPGFSDGWLGVPQRPGKPRQIGLTHVMDKGLNIRDIEGMFDTAGDFVDIVKLGWGTSYVTNNLEKKIALLTLHFADPALAAVVRRNGAVVEPTLLKAPLKTDPGHVELTVSAAGYVDRRIPLDLREGESREIRLELKLLAD